jgi:hypothetical protein
LELGLKAILEALQLLQQVVGTSSLGPVVLITTVQLQKSRERKIHPTKVPKVIGMSSTTSMEMIP